MTALHAARIAAVACFAGVFLFILDADPTEPRPYRLWCWRWAAVLAVAGAFLGWLGVTGW